MKEQKDDESLYFADNREPPTFESLRKKLFDRLDTYLKQDLLEVDKALDGLIKAF
jgi:hypothetical protein